MKKLFCFLLLGLGLVALLSSCSETKKAASLRNPEQKLMEVKKYTIFKEELRPNIGIKDSIFFYNSLRIVLSGVYTIKGEAKIINHKEVVKDTTIFIRRVIDSLTPGVIVDFIDRDKNGIKSFIFSADKNDTTYTVNFFREDLVAFKRTKEDAARFKLDPKSFILSGKATIFYKGKYLAVRAQEDFVSKPIKKGEKEPLREPCRLLYEREYDHKRIDDNKVASGWSSSASSQEPIEEEE